MRLEEARPVPEVRLVPSSKKVNALQIWLEKNRCGINPAGEAYALHLRQILEGASGVGGGSDHSFVF